ncbi:MAG: thioredoxin family protein [Pseudomonadota bacterium]|nr:thioredoxin family protein [Pseudomonadota bacterium]
MNRLPKTLIAGLVWALAASTSAAPSNPGAPAAGGIAWHTAASEAEVDAAFAAARSAGKPVFMYWGAAWCPPCNQVKATLFNRQDFIERSKAFEAVYVDGDQPGAQKVGARFHVSGYPTLVLFAPGGQEITRLPGEVEPGRYAAVMTLALGAARPVKQIVAEARSSPSRLGSNDWRLLSFYSWDTDEGQVVAKSELASTLAALASSVPASLGETALRLRLKALAAAPAAGASPPAARASDLAAVLELLGNRGATRVQSDVLSNEAVEIVRALSAPTTAPRAQLLAAYGSAMRRLEEDRTLSRADRLQALMAEVDLARMDRREAAASTGSGPALPAALLRRVRETAARADREIRDGYERQAVITAAAHLLDRAGLGAESDSLLVANLPRSHSPYYLMSQLAGNAKRRGDAPAALRWYARAYESSEGPATRLQWASSYVAALVELAPADEAAIEQATIRMLEDARGQPDAFYERSGRSLQRVAGQLRNWSEGGKHAAAMARLQPRFDALCAAAARSTGEQATCRNLVGSQAPVGGRGA